MAISVFWCGTTKLGLHGHMQKSTILRAWCTQPSELGRQRTLNSVHGHTAARLHFNGNLVV